jgi:hypothetical protein
MLLYRKSSEVSTASNCKVLLVFISPDIESPVAVLMASALSVLT